MTSGEMSIAKGKGGLRCSAGLDGSANFVSRTGRATQGVTFAKPDDGDRIIAVARSAERELVDEPDGPDVGELADGPEHDAAGPDEVDSADSIDVVVNTAAPGDAETVGSSDDESEVQA